MSKKQFYVHYEQDPSFTLKLDYDAYKDKTIQEVLQNFISEYNEKNGEKLRLEAKSCLILNDKKKRVEGSTILSKEIEPKGDLFVYIKRKCGRFGCGKTYTDVENVENCCQFHPGQPIFHEGYKKWSCCSRTGSTDFDEFLKEPGCAFGFHSDEAPKKPAFVRQEKGDSKLVSASEEKEVYKTSAVMPPTTTIPVPPPPSVPKVEEVVEEDDPPDAVIAVGTACVRNGCKKTYQNESSRTETCCHHPGVPIFHEGSKGWSCCKTKVLDFSDFLLIEGCKEGKHKFVKKEKPVEQIQCKYDWFQTPSTTVVSIYAKKLSKEESTISFEPYKLKVNLKFQDGKKFTKEIILSNPIDAEKSKYEILSTKVECKLIKLNGANWTDLEMK
jgi:hypothetical protein